MPIECGTENFYGPSTGGRFGAKNFSQGDGGFKYEPPRFKPRPVTVFVDKYVSKRGTGERGYFMSYDRWGEIKARLSAVPSNGWIERNTIHLQYGLTEADFRMAMSQNHESIKARFWRSIVDL